VRNLRMLDLDATSTPSVLAMELSIQQTARIAGTTSRTLRYYDEIGLVPPSRIGSNGYRYYDDNALMRLQRVLLLRELALGLDQISEVLAREVEESAALTTHLSLLRQEQDRLTRQIAAVEHTIQSIIGKEELMAETMFDGFDHSQYKDEVEARWGKDARAESDSWWNLKSEHEQQAWQTELFNRQRWKTRVELANAIFDYIEIFHNRQRRHSALGYLTPIEYELRSNQDTITAAS